MSAFPTLTRGTPIGTQKSSTFRTLESGFGDGYTQRAGDGLNAVRATWSLAYKWLTNADADTLEAYLEERGGYQTIDWTAPKKSSAQKWICKGYQRVEEKDTHASITILLEEIFEA